jgi:C4-dicarboxylate-specific signal transduction histidine kinase
MTYRKTLDRAVPHGGRLALGLGFLLLAGVASADLKTKVDQYTQKLATWGTNPVVVAAVKEANAKGTGDISNSKWEEMDDKNPAVVAILGSPASTQVKSWENKDIAKVYVRDQNGNLVAASNKPLLYNLASRPAFKNSMQGKLWNSGEPKPDPTTSIKSVQISAPVKDGDKVIGIIHSAVSAE